jgi:hypothetical protein
VIDPGKLVYPKAVHVVGESPGNVRNTRGLKAPGGGATTITEAGLNSRGVGSPSIILDLGFNVGGYVEIGIRGSNGTPIRLGYSELLDYLSPRGDTSGDGVIGGSNFSFGVSDDPEGRTDPSRPPPLPSSARPAYAGPSASSRCSWRESERPRSTTSASGLSTFIPAQAATAATSSPATMRSIGSGTRARTPSRWTPSGTCATEARRS